MKGSPWSVDELRTLIEKYPDLTAKELALQLHRPLSGIYAQAASLGLRKSAAFLASDRACRIQRGKQTSTMKATQFKPGLVPWCKGLKGVVGVQPECRATQFKPGSRPHTWVPVGSYRVNADGYLDRKMTDEGRGPRDWLSVHRLVWMEANGEIPSGHVVVFRPGRRTTVLEEITLDVLELVTRGELMRRNSVHTVYPPELARLIILTGAVNRQINKRAKEEAA